MDEWKAGCAELLVPPNKLQLHADSVLERLGKFKPSQLRILGFLPPNIVIFEKRNVDYSEVGEMIEHVLKEYFVD